MPSLTMIGTMILAGPMHLEFSIPEVVAVIASIIIVEQITSDGESNWIEGVQLLSVCAILGDSLLFLAKQSLTQLRFSRYRG